MGCSFREGPRRHSLNAGVQLGGESLGVLGSGPVARAGVYRSLDEAETSRRASADGSEATALRGKLAGDLGRVCHACQGAEVSPQDPSTNPLKRIGSADPRGPAGWNSWAAKPGSRCARERPRSAVAHIRSGLSKRLDLVQPITDSKRKSRRLNRLVPGQRRGSGLRQDLGENATLRPLLASPESARPSTRHRCSPRAPQLIRKARSTGRCGACAESPPSHGVLKHKIVIRPPRQNAPVPSVMPALTLGEECGPA